LGRLSSHPGQLGDPIRSLRQTPWRMGGELRPDHRNVWIQGRGRPFPGIGYHRRQTFGLEGGGKLTHRINADVRQPRSFQQGHPQPPEIDGIDTTIDRIGLLTKPRLIKHLQLCIVITSVRHESILAQEKSLPRVPSHGLH
jgi:hypothetical protein